MVKIYVVEGLCGSGKTTLCEALKKLNKFKVIDENMFIKTKELSIDEQLALQDDFFKRDIERFERAKSSDGLVVLERDFLSTLSFCYALYKTTGKTIFLDKLRELELKLAKIKIFPDVYIYLDISPKLGRDRKLASLKNIAEFGYPLDVNFYKYVQEYNKKYLNAARMETFLVDGRISIEYTLNEALKVLK